MPIYEYSCQKCGREFELLRAISQSDEPASCPKCNHEAKRKMSAFASFAKDSGGISTPIGGGSSCGGCASSNCDSCGT